MKKFLILVAVVAISMVAGCIGEVKTYTDSGQTIDIGVNQEFVIALGSNPTTGYSWQESYDESMLELVEKTYKPGPEVKQGVVGAGGVEYFRFKPLKAGEAEITLVYKRPWEEPTPQDVTKVFTANIR
ncbi:MAG: protease inhibitor I42 family protein [Dehalococcoidales bacterium]